MHNYSFGISASLFYLGYIYIYILSCSYPDIVVYLLYTTSFVTLDEVKNYKSLQSYKYFTSGWVLEVEWKKYREEGVVLIIGKVRHSYAANKTPLRPWVVVRCNGTVLVGHCTCMAGLAETCSHVGAVLHWVETAKRVRDETPCTSKENKWLMPTPAKSIPYVQLSEIDFSAPKRQKVKSPSTPSATVSTITPPSQSEKDDFFHEISQEQRKKPLILSVIKPYSDKFVHSSDHLPQLLHGIFLPDNLEKNYTELLTLAENYPQKEVTPAMVDHLDRITRDQSKSKHWFQYRAGRITASRFKQVLHTDPHQPSMSLLNSVCYPEIYKFSTQATSWGCEHEKDALLAYKAQISPLHTDCKVSSCGFFVSTEYPFLGASPDALVQCMCCGEGAVEIKCPLCAGEKSLREAVDGARNFCLEELPGGKLQLRRDHGYYFQCQMQIYVTRRLFCDFVVWTPREIHIERITLDEQLIETAIPTAKKFWRLCVLPELLGKWYTRQKCPNVQCTSLHTQTDQLEEDSGKWCFCREDKGGEMIACDGKSCNITWYHLDCVGMTQSSLPRGKWLCPTCHANKHKKTKLTKS